MGAALYMALSRTLIRTYAVEYDTRPEHALSATNRRILADTGAGLFVTAFQGVLDPSSGEPTYSNAGHNPPCLLSARDGNTVQELDGAGVPLAILDGVAKEQRIVHLPICERRATAGPGFDSLNCLNIGLRPHKGIQRC